MSIENEMNSSRNLTIVRPNPKFPGRVVPLQFGLHRLGVYNSVIYRGPQGHMYTWLVSGTRSLSYTARFGGCGQQESGHWRHEAPLLSYFIFPIGM